MKKNTGTRSKLMENSFSAMCGDGGGLAKEEVCKEAGRELKHS
jgi:hypothetical protein